MKILWFTNTPSGATHIIDKNINTGGWLGALEKELIKTGEISLIVAFYSSKKIDSFTHNNVSYLPIYRKETSSNAYKFLSRLFGYSNNDSKEIPILLSIIKEINPDVIHIHGSEENFGLILKYHKEKNIILSIQGIINAINEKTYSGIPKSIISKYEGIKLKIFLNSDNYLSRRRIFRAKTEEIILKNAKYCIGRTTWDNRVLKVFNRNVKYFISNEIMRDSFYINKWSKEKFSEKFQIITISGDKYYKGFETIVKTAKILKNNLNMNFEWLVIGLSKKSRTVKIVQRWLKSDFNEYNIKLLGTKQEFEVSKMLTNSDMYCQVSHIENSSNALSEAMLTGIPIVATIAGGTSTLLQDREEGLLVQEGELYSIAGAIYELYSNFYEAEKFGANARITALKKHNKGEVTKNIISIYKEIIKNSN